MRGTLPLGKSLGLGQRAGDHAGRELHKIYTQERVSLEAPMSVGDKSLVPVRRPSGHGFSSARASPRPGPAPPLPRHSAVRCPRLSLRRVRYAFCPLCLANQQVVHARWDWCVACLTLCDIHGTPLLDKCSACGEPDPLTFSGVHPEDHGEGEEMGRAVASLLRPLVILPSSFWVTLQIF
jgi:hypothetical protein